MSNMTRQSKPGANPRESKLKAKLQKGTRSMQVRPRTRTPKGKVAGEGGRCGAKLCNRNGTCRNQAGLRTAHLGIGRCYRHGGCSPIKTGVYSQVMKEKRIGEYHAFYDHQRSNAHTLRSLDDEIALLRVCAAYMMNSNEKFTFGPSKIERLASILEAITRAIKRKVDIELQRAIRLTPADTEKFVDILEAILTKHIGDTTVLAAIGRDLRTAFLGGNRLDKDRATLPD